MTTDERPDGATGGRVDREELRRALEREYALPCDGRLFRRAAHELLEQQPASELLVAIARCEGDPNDAYELMGKLAALLGFDLDDAVAEAEAAEVDN